LVTCRLEGKKSIRFNLGESIFFILLISLAMFILIGSPLFEIRQITVEGNEFFTGRKIVAVSGIELNTNIFKVNLAQATDRLKTMPMLKEAHITRDLPSRVLIRVIERKPVAFLPSAGGFILVDAEGVYCREGKIGEAGLPVITGPFVRIPPAGQVIKDPGLQVALKVLSSLSGELTGDLSEIHVDRRKEVILYTLEGIQCRLGPPEDLVHKGSALVQVLDRLKGKKIEYVDLSIVGFPVVKYKGEG
jgi:cell division protein FtsQ